MEGKGGGEAMPAYCLNEGWQFAREEPRNFQPVTLPHDWLIGDVGNLYKSGAGWYRRELDVSFLREGQRVFLRFDGVYMDSTLYVNGEMAGEWKYGYTAFEFDITRHLRLDRPNILLLGVRYDAPNSRWYTGAGIYRDVVLKVKNPCHFLSDGLYITTWREEDGWRYEVEAEVETGGRPYALRHALLGVEEGIRAWDIEDPRLYTMESELLVEGQVTDRELTRFGFREIAFDPDRGLFLNGRPLKLKGVCLHHDLGGLGAAVYPDAIRRQLTLLKEMGANAIRTAHNPPAKAFMDIADEMGLLVMSEIFDVWRRSKNPYDYARFFDQWAARDVAAWIRRDRNHPSVILWSLGNEIYDTHADAKEGSDTLRFLMGEARKHDPKNHAPVTLCSNYMPWENTQRCADLMKIVGYNYAEYLYPKHHQEHPDWVLYGAETCATVQSRGVYRFPLSQSVLADDDLQCSALGNSSTSWGAKSVEACIASERNAPFSLGQFIWAGQDYLVEPTPYHTKNSYLGHMDTAGFPKDSYFLFQAAWRDPLAAPMVYLYPYWDFSPGQPIDVRVCSNRSAVELFLEGESLGRTALEGRIAADFQVPYRPGVLTAVAYDAKGNPVAEMTRRSFGDARDLVLSEETYGELTFVTIAAVDGEGRTVENANRRVRVRAENGTLLALDNGDAADQEQYTAHSRRLFGGKLLAVVQGEKGAKPKVTAELDEKDIPIRKVELTREGDIVRARTFPPDATYGDLRWRLTDAAGIDSPLGSLIVAEDGRSTTLLPRGDGTAYVRCGPGNGKDHWAFISQIPVVFEGLGTPFLDPYAFVAGGLYNAGNVPLTNGNERGVATLRDGESDVGFRGLDFGPYGSDELILPLFPLDKEPFFFEIWEGLPLEGGQKICTVLYDKGSLWNTYQEITCLLPRRLRGVTTLCFVFRQKVHLKGFRFVRKERAFARLAAGEHDAAYGDSYTLCGDAVEGIGNNVTLLFEGMDFGEQGAGSVRICWRSRHPRNSIQFLFEGIEGERRVMVELPGAEAYAEAAFSLGERVTGPQRVSLIFLPGTELDLAWIQFQAE